MWGFFFFFFLSLFFFFLQLFSAKDKIKESPAPLGASVPSGMEELRKSKITAKVITLDVCREKNQGEGST